MKSVRALLIQPPNIGGVKSLLSHMGEEGESIGFKPPLGLLYIATYLKEKTSHDVIVLDAQAERLTFDQCVRRVVDYKPDVVGISAWTDWWYPAYHVGCLIKNRLPRVHMCYGGPHISIYADKTLSLDNVDSVIVGDGEVPFTQLCTMVSNQFMHNNFPGLHFKEYGINHDKLFYIQENLDELPIPDRTLLPLRNYTSVLTKSNLVTTMITSRGCPYRCVYCKLNFQRTMCRSAASVVEEFIRIEKLGIKEIEVYDDTFTWSKKRVIDICQGLIRNNITIQWAIRDRVNTADPDILKLLKRAGCTRIHYGIESGVDSVLHAMKKNITTEQARQAVASAKENGIVTLTYFMFGNMSENIEQMRKTIDFALELDSDYAEFSITMPYPGTELYNDALKQGRITNDYWDRFASHPTQDFYPPELAGENVPLEQLIRIRNEAIRRFYFRPKFILKEIVAIRNSLEFKRKSRMGLRLLRSLLNPHKENR